MTLLIQSPILVLYSCSLLSLAALSLFCALARKLGLHIENQIPKSRTAVKYD
ncbi:Protein of unknown function [Pyronema omphalodes CBS 100304]|uniref:Uncharacterized protein n=1 Tax=Pyronema omphalodes (strain CBS 100304) TaxID=1076935 RepID=U4L474_PYROM|nr:Protein of unknown function [Pyronema omphalodes CBS 100304]